MKHAPTLPSRKRDAIFQALPWNYRNNLRGPGSPGDTYQRPAACRDRRLLNEGKDLWTIPKR